MITTIVVSLLHQITIKDTTMKTTEEIKGKTISELINTSILPANEKEIPMPGMTGRSDYEFVIENSDAYGKWVARLTEKQLVGTEKQVTWATEIRLNKAKSAAFEIVARLHMTKISDWDLDWNKWSNRILKEEFSANNAGWWIQNRF